MGDPDPTNGARRKLALVIGNGAYEREENRIQSCLENTNRLAMLLRESDFRVEVYHNCSSQKDMVECIEEGDLILAYYCGHSCHHKGTNYLLPTGDRKVNDHNDIEDLASDAESLIDRLVEKNAYHANIFVFDCCRSYHLRDTSTTPGNMIDR